MRNTLFNDEVEGYTNPLNVKYWILATLIFSSAVFVGYILNVLPKLVAYMDFFADIIKP